MQFLSCFTMQNCSWAQKTFFTCFFGGAPEAPKRPPRGLQKASLQPCPQEAPKRPLRGPNKAPRTHIFTPLQTCSHIFTFVQACSHMFTYVHTCSHIGDASWVYKNCYFVEAKRAFLQNGRLTHGSPKASSCPPGRPATQGPLCLWNPSHRFILNTCPARRNARND